MAKKLHPITKSLSACRTRFTRFRSTAGNFAAGTGAARRPRAKKGATHSDSSSNTSSAYCSGSSMRRSSSSASSKRSSWEATNDARIT
eukprot:Skav223302  [mRNA]  locus=scaffold4198:163081:165925:+ [translate_table: standard]